MSGNNKHIDRLTPELMERYQNGELSDREMHAVERLMLDSDFDAEAMEGMASIGPEAFHQDINQLEARLNKHTQKRTRRMSPWWLAAAAIILLMTAGILLFDNLLTPVRPPVAQESMDTQPADADKGDDPQNQPAAEATPDSAGQSDRLALAEEDAQSSSGKKEDAVRREAEATPEEEVSSGRDDDHQVDIASADVIAEKSAKRISAVPRMDSDSAPVSSLPSPEIVARQESLVGVIKGEEVEIITPMPGRPLDNIHGRVIDKRGAPVPYARLNVMETNQAFVTNKEGEFELALEDEDDNRLIVSLVGLKAQNIRIPDQDSLIILLDEDTASLSAVVLNEKTADNNVIFRGAGPVGGTDAYEKYIRQSAQYPANGVSGPVELIVIFSVDTDGKPGDFRVRKSPGQEFTREAIRLIEDGPAWKPALEDGSPVRDRVRVRVRFEK